MSSKRRKETTGEGPLPSRRQDDDDLFDLPPDIEDELDELYDESDLDTEELDDEFEDGDDEEECEHGVPYDEFCEECAEDEEEDGFPEEFDA